MKTQIQSVHFDADQKLIEFINKRMSKLEHFSEKIIDSDIILSMEQLNTTVREKVVVIKTKLPGTLLVAKEKSKKFEESVDLAVESIRRQIEKHKNKLAS